MFCGPAHSTLTGLLFIFFTLCRVFIPRCEGSHPLYTYKSTAWMAYGGHEPVVPPVMTENHLCTCLWQAASRTPV
jgi:hypothetical protein